MITVAETKYMNQMPVLLKEIKEQLEIMNKLKAYELEIAVGASQSKIDEIMKRVQLTVNKNLCLWGLHKHHF